MTDFTALGLPADLPEIMPPDLALPEKTQTKGPVLSAKQKAAIVVRVLVSGGGQISLTEMPASVQSELTRTLAELNGIDKSIERQVVAEFLKELEEGSQSATGLSGALSMLEGSISHEVAQELGKGAPSPRRADPWPRIAGFDVKQISEILEIESAEISAVCLSKLPGKLAAEVLGHMSGPKARLAAFTVSRISNAKPMVVRTIGLSLLDQLSKEPKRAFDNDPAELVGSMLLLASSKTRDDIMEGLKEEDEGFAGRVRDEIFIFSDISERIEYTDIPKILRDVDQSVLLNALKFSEDLGGTDAISADFFLDNMSKRLAEGLREEKAQLPSIPEETGEAAQNSIVEAIRTLETDGTLKLKPREKNTEE